MANNEQKTIRRGTTPLIRINTNADISNLNIELCISNNGYQIIRSTKNNDIENYGRYALTNLTQEETLALKPNTKAEVQIRLVSDGNNATASTIKTVAITDVLRNGKITN